MKKTRRNPKGGGRNYTRLQLFENREKKKEDDWSRLLQTSCGTIHLDVRCQKQHQQIHRQDQ